MNSCFCFFTLVVLGTFSHVIMQKTILQRTIFSALYQLVLSNMEGFQTLQLQMKTMILRWIQRLSQCIFVVSQDQTQEGI